MFKNETHNHQQQKLSSLVALRLVLWSYSRSTPLVVLMFIKQCGFLVRAILGLGSQIVETRAGKLPQQIISKNSSAWLFFLR